MLVKICGIQTKEAAKVATEQQANMIGFVFTPSKRRITPNKAAVIANEVPPSVKKVGVFVNESLSNIKFIARHVGLDIIQLHGDEPVSFAKEVPYPIIKAFSIDQVNNDTVNQYPCDYYLIDSPPSTYRGGSGKTFQWERINELKIDKSKLIIAGGLSIDNVEQAIKTAIPAGVDVSSGVETDGIKDLTKIKQFIELAKQPVLP